MAKATKAKAKARTKPKPKPKPKRRPPPIEHGILLTATLCLLAGGAVMVYSASSARDLLSGAGDGTGYLEKSLLYGAIGLLLMRFLSRHGLEAVRRATPMLLMVSFGLLIAVMLPGIGVEVNGARRWVGAGPLTFQPSELMKLALVLYAAQLLATDPDRVKTVKGIVSPLLVIAGAACLLVAAQPDLGTALVIAFTLCALLVAAGMPLRLLLLFAGLAAGAVILFALL